VLSHQVQKTGSGAALPPGVAGLLGAAVVEVLIFGVILGAAWLCSRATVDQLMLRWKGILRPVWLGLVYSIALRVLVAAVVIAVLLGFMAAGFSEQQLVDQLRPKTEVIVDPDNLRENPVYLWLTLTLISFVVAGLREELWRAGMLAALFALFPAMDRGALGRAMAIAITALVFGVGHLAQGWGAVGATTLLGVGLGVIMVCHRSIWEAVLAHGFFNAASFLAIYWLSEVLTV
jgi:membrane protease YdiL (CAAX protease family)